VAFVEGDPGLLVHRPDRVLPGGACESLGLRTLQRFSTENPAGAAFVVFAVLFLQEKLAWNYLVAFCLLIGAAVFAFAFKAPA
jgi:hypothetical protein